MTEEFPEGMFDQPAPTQDALARMRAAAEAFVEQKKYVDELTEKLKEAKATYQEMEQDTLPSLMLELGFTEMKLLDGTSIQIQDEIACSITEAMRPAALAWLTENGFDGLIKTAISIPFVKEDREEATELARELFDRYGGDVELKEVVHPATLKSFVKEQLAAANPLPMDLFGVHPYKIAKIEMRKKK